MKNGTVDVVIGTHRLLSKDFAFKDLGLVIVDEEQRFGVEHKEALKKMRTNVDVLAMSATPIPRTLEMSLTGIRETSTLATPPEERHPVLTYVGPYTDKQTSAAIRRELMREGQVFFVHNRVSTIDRTAAKIRELVPEARVERWRTARCPRAGWSRSSLRLLGEALRRAGLHQRSSRPAWTSPTQHPDRGRRGQIRALPAAQLRGRCGPQPGTGVRLLPVPLGEAAGRGGAGTAQAVATHNELGAGMQLAMKDLEIRGAGNLLGGEQSGHIQGVGFDLYIRLVGEAVADYRGEAEEKAAEMRSSCRSTRTCRTTTCPANGCAWRPTGSWPPRSATRPSTRSKAELVDRYGELPLPAKNLVAVARFRVGAREAGLTDVALQGNFIKFSPAQLPESKLMRLARMYHGSRAKPALDAVLIPKPKTARVGGRDLQDAEILAWAKRVIEAIFSDAPLPVG